jgi:hypothetical protein
MTSSITNYKIYCTTEAKFVTGWGTAAPTVCYNNNTHSVDVGQVSSLETVINVNANSTSTVQKYKIYCATEAKYVEGWGSTEPTTCYNNTTHTVNLSSVQTLETVNNSQVKVIEDGAAIARNVKIVSINFENVAAGETQTKTYTFRIVTSMYSYKFATDDTNKGDEITIAIKPNTVLGLITANITAGNTVIYAPAAIFLYGWPGFNVYASDGTNLDDLGEIISLDSVAGTMTVQTAAVHNFSSTNTVIMMTYFNMKSMKIGPPQMYAFGEDVIGGAAVPVGTVVHFSYKNNQAISELDEPKNMSVYLTLLF